MPLSERMRLDAGRPFVHTLTARILVACFLILAILFTSSKHDSSQSYNLDITKQNLVSSNKTVAKNDIISR